MLGFVVRRALRRLHPLRDSNPIPGELRGWRWDEPPIRPSAYLGLGVSEVAYRYCSTMRDVWLRRRGVKGAFSNAMTMGLVVHEVFHYAASDLRILLSRSMKPWDAYRILYDRAETRFKGKPAWARELYRSLILMWAGESAGSTIIHGGIGIGWLPWISEYRVDGSPLGLSSSLRVDALGDAGVVVDIKYGRRDRRQRVGLAGYALALEAELEAPFDYGVIIHVEDVERGNPRISVEPVYISGELRQDFIEARDDVIEMLLEGVEPPVAGSCPDTCPFLRECHNGGWGKSA
ncbi:MAG: type I-A CRISPR-associated protein Cas4/Csa1 [Desulfurococcales archaeon]|nr:type I-A CRISPR-associated protein Cas4/Csa1 [Desulfurococcales archaeon]